MKLAVLAFFAYVTFTYAQQNIDKLNVNQLKLPKESVSRATIIDATGQVKASSSVSDTELSYLDGLSDTLLNLLAGKANDSSVVKLTTDQSISGTKTFTGKLVSSTTLNGAIPCPVMTETQRNAFTPVQGDCVYNSTSLKLNVFDGSVWKDAGGAGGVSLWLTANPYLLNDVVIESDRIYRCLVAHTSGTFATDLAANRWVEVSASPSTPYSLANGGTNKALTAVNGGIVWVDTDSFEVLGAGTSGQILQSNGAASPSWVNKSISSLALNSTSQTTEEVQAYNNQLTQTASGKHLLETSNQNILVNPSFEHSTFSTGWTTATGGTPTENLVNEVHGLKAYSISLSAALSLRQDSTLYASELNGSVQGLASVRVKSSNVVTLCARRSGSTISSLCVSSSGSNTWEFLRVPFLLGATSNGLNISTVATSGSVLIDDAFVGPVIGLESCASTLECTDTFSTYTQSSGTVRENIDWVNGNASASTGIYTYTLNTGIFTVSPNCVASAESNTAPNVGVVCTITSASSSQIIVRCSQGGTNANYPHSLICQKQGVDFVAKTVKAAASDQNVRTPGVVNSIIRSAKISITGAISDESGEWISGNCVMTNPVNTCTISGFASAPTCNVTHIGEDLSVLMAKVGVTTSTQLRYVTQLSSANTYQAGPVTVTCHGVSP